MEEEELEEEVHVPVGPPVGSVWERLLFRWKFYVTGEPNADGRVPGNTEFTYNPGVMEPQVMPLGIFDPKMGNISYAGMRRIS